MATEFLVYSSSFTDAVRSSDVGLSRPSSEREQEVSYVRIRLIVDLWRERLIGCLFRVNHIHYHPVYYEHVYLVYC